MNLFVRHTFLIVFVWLMLAGVALAKQVYLKGGGIIDSQSAWKRGDKCSSRSTAISSLILI